MSEEYDELPHLHKCRQLLLMFNAESILQCFSRDNSGLLWHSDTLLAHEVQLCRPHTLRLDHFNTLGQHFFFFHRGQCGHIECLRAPILHLSVDDKDQTQVLADKNLIAEIIRWFCSLWDQEVMI